MKKQPVGYFIDPSTKELIIIISREKEAAGDARKRVAEAHNVSEADISQTPPEGATLSGGVVIDVPDRVQRPNRPKRFDRGDQDPNAAIGRFENRLNGAPPPSSPPIVGQLLTGGGSMLGGPPAPHTRSTPEAEGKR